ncbi:MAG: hypothetical protein PHO56_03360 [Patescibacteria group bacterium]|nr:hypothetical protein [Patescibacteria group bacterium]
MNKEQIIKTVIIAASGFFVLLVAILFLNYFINGKNSGKIPAAPVITPGKSTSAVSAGGGNKTATSSSAQGSQNQPVDAKVLASFKASVAKDIAANINKVPQNIAQTMKSVGDCAAEKTEADKDLCVTVWAEYEKDPSLCNQISSSSRQDCQDKALIDQAIAEKKIDLCTNVKSLKWSCISLVADAAQTTEADCVALPSAEAKLCLTRVLTAKAKSAADCSSIIDAGIKQLCLNNFYANLPK